MRRRGSGQPAGRELGGGGARTRFTLRVRRIMCHMQPQKHLSSSDIAFGGASTHALATAKKKGKRWTRKPREPVTEEQEPDQHETLQASQVLGIELQAFTLTPFETGGAHLHALDRKACLRTHSEKGDRQSLLRGEGGLPGATEVASLVC